MDISEAIKKRHSVRQYTDKKIEGEVFDALSEEIRLCNSEGGLNMQLIVNEPNAFDSFMAHYGKFRNVRNYIAVIGKNEKDLSERAGYYGERVVIKAQMLGLNTCWVALTFSKGKAQFNLANDEKLVCVIAIGYGETQGIERKSKAVEKVSRCSGERPQWFESGVRAALLAPTAMNQQKFMFTLNGNRVKAEALWGPYSKVDIGIAKYNFEAVAGKENFVWE